MKYLRLEKEERVLRETIRIDGNKLNIDEWDNVLCREVQNKLNDILQIKYGIEDCLRICPSTNSHYINIDVINPISKYYCVEVEDGRYGVEKLTNYFDIKIYDKEIEIDIE